MVAVGDPVGTKLVASLAHPGGNATGLTSIAPDLAPEIGKHPDIKGGIYQQYCDQGEDDNDRHTGSAAPSTAALLR